MSSGFKIYDVATAQGDRAAVVPLEGRLDSTVTFEVRRQLQQIVDFYPNLLLDLSKVTHFDSSGMGVLISTLRKCREKGGHLCLFSLPDVVSVAFDAASLHKMFVSYSDESTAIANFPNSSL